MISIRNYKIDSFNRRVADKTYAIELEESKNIVHLPFFPIQCLKQCFKMMEEYLNESKHVSNDDEFVSIYDKELFQRKILEKESEKEGIKKSREEGRLAKEKEDAVSFYQNGVSAYIICKSLNISEEQ